jgi:hypothetical protein
MLGFLALLAPVRSMFFFDSVADSSDFFASPTRDWATTAPLTPGPQGVTLTSRQQAIVYGVISATVLLVMVEAVLTLYCRRRNRRRIPVELEEVMLPSPDEAYGLAPL